MNVAEKGIAKTAARVDRCRAATAGALALMLGSCAADVDPDDPVTIVPEPTSSVGPPVPEAEDAPPSAARVVAVSDDPVALVVRIVRWSAERLELDYGLVNGHPFPVVAFDDAPGDTYGGFDGRGVVELLEEEGTTVLFKGAVYRDDCLNPVVPVTVGGRPLAPGDTSSGMARVELPLASLCGGTPTDADPSTVRLCVGYVPASDPALEAAREAARAITARDDRYRVGLLPEQRRSCATLER